MLVRVKVFYHIGLPLTSWDHSKLTPKFIHPLLSLRSPSIQTE
nr:MAG TPA: hypothetical protein [Caudoviricetes sp.]